REAGGRRTSGLAAIRRRQSLHRIRWRASCKARRAGRPLRSLRRDRMPAARGRRPAMELECRRHIAPAARAGSLMPVIDGAMQDFALTLDKFLDYAAKWHPRTEVVTAVENR